MVGFGVSLMPVWDVEVVSVWGAKFNRDGTLGDPIEFRGGFRSENVTQRQILLGGDRLITGIGVGTKDHKAVGIMAQSATASRYPDVPEIGSGFRLTDYRLEPSELHRATYMAPEQSVITGVGIRANQSCISTMQVTSRELPPDGMLGDRKVQGRGWHPFHEPEGPLVVLPEGHVAVGVGLSIEPMADCKDIMLWGAPLKEDGTLGKPEEFHGGFHPEPGTKLQRQILLEPGRVLTGFGFWINDHETVGLMVMSAKIEKVE